MAGELVMVHDAVFDIQVQYRLITSVAVGAEYICTCVMHVVSPRERFSLSRRAHGNGTLRRYSDGKVLTRFDQHISWLASTPRIE